MEYAVSQSGITVSQRSFSVTSGFRINSFINWCDSCYLSIVQRLILFLLMIPLAGNAQFDVDTSQFFDREWRIVMADFNDRAYDEPQTLSYDMSFRFDRDSTFRVRIWETMADLKGTWKLVDGKVWSGIEDLDDMYGPIIQPAPGTLYMEMASEYSNTVFYFEEDSLLPLKPEYQPCDTLPAYLTRSWTFEKSYEWTTDSVRKEIKKKPNSNQPLGYNTIKFYQDGRIGFNGGNEDTRWKAWNGGKRITFSGDENGKGLEKLSYIEVISLSRRKLVFNLWLLFPLKNDLLPMCLETHWTRDP